MSSSLRPAAARGLGIGVLLLFLATLASPADAFRAPRDAEFDAIAAAVAKNPDGDYYCAERASTWVSTLRSRWALAQMRSNCGLGSQTVRFFLKRRIGQQKGWRLVERHYERLGTGEGIPCGSRRTPADIRCGPLVVHDRLAPDANQGDSRPFEHGVIRRMVFSLRTGTLNGVKLGRSGRRAIRTSFGPPNRASTQHDSGGNRYRLLQWDCETSNCLIQVEVRNRRMQAIGVFNNAFASGGRSVLENYRTAAGTFIGMSRREAEQRERQGAKQGCVLSIIRERRHRRLMLNISDGAVSSILLLTDAAAYSC